MEASAFVVTSDAASSALLALNSPRAVGRAIGFALFFAIACGLIVFGVQLTVRPRRRVQVAGVAMIVVGVVLVLGVVRALLGFGGS